MHKLLMSLKRSRHRLTSPEGTLKGNLSESRSTKFQSPAAKQPRQPEAWPDELSVKERERMP